MARSGKNWIARGLRAALLGGVMLAAGVASAQPGPGLAPEVTFAPTWTSPRLERIGQMLTGTWKTDAAVSVAGDAGESVNIVLSVAPIGINGMPNALYCEVARADSMWAPYRQTVFQLFEYKGNVRLRTYEFHNANVDKNAFIGAWAMPEAFPPLSADKFIATLDIQGTDSDGGFTGRTPAAYPTAVGGAVEMTSAIELSGNRLVTEDRGFDAEGNVVWGQEQSGRYVYSKVAPEAVGVSVSRQPNGLVMVKYGEGAGTAGQPGDTISLHYTGWFTRNATVFDSSRTRGIPFSYQLPGQMIQGWIQGTDGIRPGERRRMYIPYDLGYGEAGQPPRMPARSNLVFDVECLSVQPTPQRDPTNARPARPNNSAVDSSSNPG